MTFFCCAFFPSLFHEFWPIMCVCVQWKRYTYIKFAEIQRILSKHTVDFIFGANLIYLYVLMQQKTKQWTNSIGKEWFLVESKRQVFTNSFTVIKHTLKIIWHVSMKQYTIYKCRKLYTIRYEQTISKKKSCFFFHLDFFSQQQTCWC